MKTPFTLMLLLFLCLIANKTNAQDYCNTPRFDTTDVFKRAELRDTLLVYGHNRDWQGKMDTLQLKLYYPDNKKDDFSQRPLIVMVHGGGFVRGSLKSSKKREMYFAQKGFVVASIDYRLGWEQDCVPGNDTSLGYAMYRGVQDLNAAIRYLVHHAATYKIDTKRILLNGESAGALASLADVFVSQTEFNKEIPKISDKLGDLDNATNSLTDKFTVRAVISKSGGVFDTSYIDPKQVIPVLMIHGTDDHVVPYGSGTAYNCNYYVPLQGSSVIKTRLQNLDGCYELDFQEGGGHGSVYNGEDSFVTARESHFYKRVLCKECRQIVYQNEILIQNKKLSGVIASSSQQNIVSSE